MTRELDPDVRFLDLDLARVGDALVRLVLTARQLGHKHVAGTAQDYCHPSSPEMEFVRDAFLRAPEKIAGLWFGGTENAVRFTSVLLTETMSRASE